MLFGTVFLVRLLSEITNIQFSAISHLRAHVCRCSQCAPGNGAWRSLVAHLVWDQRVAGSNPAAPTIWDRKTGLGSHMLARIYKPAKSAMQSGKAQTDKWVLEFEASAPRKIDPLMGYTTSSDMNSQILLEFETLEAAKEYAASRGLAYSVTKPQQAKRRVMSYAENFSSDRSLPWTH